MGKKNEVDLLKAFLASVSVFGGTLAYLTLVGIPPLPPPLKAIRQACPENCPMLRTVKHTRPIGSCGLTEVTQKRCVASKCILQNSPTANVAPVKEGETE